MLGIFLDCFSTLFIAVGSLSNLELTDKAGLTSQPASGIPSLPSKPDISRGLPHPPNICVGFGDPNSDPHNDEKPSKH